MIPFEHLPRWIQASASFEINSRADGVITFFEGIDKLTEPQEAAEFRMDGPRFTELSKGYWEIWVAINILVQTTMNDSDFYMKYRILGKLVQALKDDFSIFKFGDGPDDDESLVGCMSLIHDKFNRLQVNHFGQVEKDIRLEQATIEAKYRMYLQE